MCGVPQCSIPTHTPEFPYFPEIWGDVTLIRCRMRVQLLRCLQENLPRAMCYQNIIIY